MPDADEFMSAVPEGTIRIGFPYEGVSRCDHQWDDLVRASEPFAGYKPPPPSDTYTLIYTSGTTGNPKGVIITIGNMLFAANGLPKSMPPKGQERFFSYLPLAHAFERGAAERARSKDGLSGKEGSRPVKSRGRPENKKK